MSWQSMPDLQTLVEGYLVSRFQIDASAVVGFGLVRGK